jgi:uncharacterized membrane protein YdjX (TVP38/TMEM64 family)
MPDPAADEDAPRRKGVNLWRIGLVLLLTVGLWVAGKQTGLIDELDIEAVRETVRGSGVFGVLVYLGVFAGGELLHVPGIVFVAAAILSWGELLGFPLSLLGSVVSVSVSFVVVRAVGGKALAGLDRPLFRKVLSHLDDRPIRTVFVLRLFLFLAPALNYALAMTNVRFRDYIVGSTLGLVPPLLVVTFLFDWVINWLNQ